MNGSRGLDRGETAFAVFLVLLSGFYLWQTAYVPDPPRNVIVGPRTFPFIVGGLMLGCAIAIAWRRLRSSADEALVPDEESDASIRDWPAVGVVLGAFLALAALVEPLGFVLAFFLFLFGLSTFFAPESWRSNLLVGGLFSPVIYLIFVDVLEIPLPNGLLSPLF